MTYEQKLQVFKNLLELAMYQEEFISFLKLKSDFIIVKLLSCANTTDILDFLEDMYQYYLESK